MSDPAITRTPRKGDRVVIPKGARIWGTHPSLPKNAGRTYTVTVYDFGLYQGAVCWPGAGGYWHYTSDWAWENGSPTTSEQEG